MRVMKGDPRSSFPLHDTLRSCRISASPDLTVTVVGDYLDGRLGEIESAAPVGPHALDPRPTLWHFSPGRTGVPSGQERLLDLCRRSHGAEPVVKGCSTAKKSFASPFSPLARRTVAQVAGLCAEPARERLRSPGRTSRFEAARPEPWPAPRWNKSLHQDHRGPCLSGGSAPTRSK
jgi:hypothetical protein